MATTSNNDIAYAIYSASKGKRKDELPIFFKKVVQFLDERHLLSKSGEIFKKLDEIINLEEDRVVVKVSSVKKLTEKAKKELHQFIEKRYKAKEVLFIEELNDKLLGGVRLEIKDEVIDLTIKNKINKLQEHLIKKYE